MVGTEQVCQLMPKWRADITPVSLKGEVGSEDMVGEWSPVVIGY